MDAQTDDIKYCLPVTQLLMKEQPKYVQAQTFVHISFLIWDIADFFFRHYLGRR